MEDEELKRSIQELNEEDAKKWLYHNTLELYRYQDMALEVLNYIKANPNQETSAILKIIQKWELK